MLGTATRGGEDRMRMNAPVPRPMRISANTAEDIDKVIYNCMLENRTNRRRYQYQYERPWTDDYSVDNHR